ncbi:MAG: GatB/YqeY domain-containing protein [Alphaproteobacteria bacterium GM7ARS4]|nr:GatB/YqeY domain-containing protein [Alphaproteobacteria bacterium GM7ARS4]
MTESSSQLQGMRDTLRQALNRAIKTKDALCVSSLRMILAEITRKDIDARTGSKGATKAIDDQAIMALLHTMVKKRQESADLYLKGGRPELADKEKKEIGIIQTFLPAMLSTEDTLDAIDTTIKDIQATTIKDMGRVIASLKQRHGACLDMAKVSALVKERLGALPKKTP